MTGEKYKEMNVLNIFGGLTYIILGNFVPILIRVTTQTYHTILYLYDVSGCIKKFVVQKVEGCLGDFENGFGKERRGHDKRKSTWNLY